MIGVCLLTCDRIDYTRQTLETFGLHNAGRDFVKLHADDGSRDRANMVLAREHGFETVWRAPERQGGGQALDFMWHAAADLGCDRILHLENDWESVAPVPDIDWPCVRLTGAAKGRGKLQALSATRDLNTRRIVNWHSHSEGWEASIIHWGGPPSVTRTDLLLPAVSGAKVLKEIGAKISLPTLRPTENIVWHIGAVTTDAC